MDDFMTVLVVLVVSLLGAYLVIYFAARNAIRDAANPPEVTKGFRAKTKVTDGA